MRFLSVATIALLASGAVAGDAVVGTLDGAAHRGVIESLDGEHVAVKTASNGIVRLNINNLLSIDFSDAKPSPDGSLVLVCTDGATLVGTQFTSSDRTAMLTTAGSVRQIPLQHVAGVLFSLEDASAVGRWREKALLSKTRDVLTIRKQGQLFDIEGIIDDVGSDALTFVLDKDRVPVKRERVYALHYAGGADAIEPVAEVFDRQGNRWVVSRFEFRDGRFKATTGTGLPIEWVADELLRVDYSLGRIEFLSDLKPSVSQHTPFFDTAWPVYRNRSPFGSKKLQIMDQPYSKGLAVHSKTVLHYDLSQSYRQFETSIGIEDQAGPLGDAMVRMRADDNLVFESRVRAGEQPLAVSIAVERVKTLILEVDYGEYLDLGDWVVFGNARLVK